jgi:aldehyde:ferredoxin oxidoreductase
MANRINGFSVTKYETRKYHCYGCPFGCGGLCLVPGEPLLKETHRPEYETLCGFGAQLLVDNVESIFMVNELLNRAGIDTISCATTLNWAFEAYEKGVLTLEDTGGLELTWGNHQAVVALVKKIATGEGIGAILKDGVMRSAKHFGGSELAAPMHVHGQELPMHDSRNPGGGLDLGVGYETEPTPGRHTSTFSGWDQYEKPDRPKNKLFDKFRLKSRYEKPVDDDHEQQGERLRGNSCSEDIINGAGLCNFGFYFGPVLPLVEWLNATTGWNKSFDDYLLIGQRIKTVRHAFNIREGVDVANLRMPERARGNPPLSHGPNAYSANVLQWDEAKKDYYRAMGWDEATAVPLRETLRKLQLPEVEKAIYGN